MIVVVIVITIITTINANYNKNINKCISLFIYGVVVNKSVTSSRIGEYFRPFPSAGSACYRPRSAKMMTTTTTMMVMMVMMIKLIIPDFTNHFHRKSS